MERGLKAHAKIINLGPLEQSLQADLGRNVLLFVNFLLIKGQYYLVIRMSKAKACMIFRSN